jgi:alpha-galactosidase
MRRFALCFCFVLASFQIASAQIQYSEARKLWLITTPHTSYAMGVGPTGELQHLYWGGPLWRIEDVPAAEEQRDISSFDPHEMLENEEYPGWGGPRYYEPALKITRADGDRDLVLHYVRHRTNGNELEITVKDIRDDIEATLHYRAYPDASIIARWAVIRNGTNQKITVERAQSATWYMPRGTGYRLSYLSGRWAAETQLTQEPIQQGSQVLDSRLGHTGHYLNPWFAVDRGDANQQHGRVWFGALAWSGNWRITVEQTPFEQVRVTGGFNTFDFAYVLKPGESLPTPEFYAGFSDQGFGEASRLMDRLELADIEPHGLQAPIRPILYNSWEATEFNVSEAGQEALADKAAKLGVELFVIDDGWFGARNTDRAGLGDWVPNPQKFPHGLTPLIQHVNQLGMQFGLWVEPEMVNPDSNLYRAHPDWVMNFRGRPRSELRNQLVLNLARDDVRDYIFGFLDKLLSQNKISYLKWDMNRTFSEPGWPEVAPDKEKELWVKYVWNYYDILKRLREKYPNLQIQSCSGGGGRIDLGVLRYVDEFWTSDNTEAFDRLAIQDGYTYAYSPKLMSAWVTDVPNMNGRSTPLQFRFLVAMQGALGIGANLNKWTDADAQFATKMIGLDKRIRRTVQFGNLYRILSPRTHDTTANEYVSGDGSEALLFAFRHSQEYDTLPPVIYLQGLDSRALYRLESLDGKLRDKEQQEVSGAWLMQEGLQLVLRGDFDSTLVMLHKIQ